MDEIDNLHKIFNCVLNKKYHIEFKIYYEIKKINGYLINYNGGNVILFDDKNETIYHIPYNSIEYMFPIIPIKKLKYLKNIERNDDNEN